MNIKHIENRMLNLHEEYQEEMRKIEQAIMESQAILDKLLADIREPKKPITDWPKDDAFNRWSN